jgi:hypothetical protein
MRLRFLITVAVSLLAVSHSPAQVGQAAREPDQNDHLSSALMATRLISPLAKNTVELPSERYAALAERVVPRLVLSALSTAEVEANSRSDGKQLRIGINRDLPLTTASQGDLVVIDGKTIWRLEIESEGALATRLYVSKAFSGSRLYVRTQNDSAAYTVAAVEGGKLWTFPTTGPSVRVEIEVPVPMDTTEFSSAFRFEKFVHIYKDGNFGSSESCNLDVSCYPDWRTTSSDAVGRMFMSGPGFTAVCSGTLINNKSGDFSPLFLTAAHCLAEGVDLSSIGISWRYRSTGCNSTTRETDPLFLMSTGGGAELLGQSGAADMALLRLKGSVPRMLTWAGWNATTAAEGSSVTGIHHPHGDPQKISFGLIDAPDPQEPDHYRMHWSQGVTEPGSSGSAIFNSNHEILGTLSGGFSHCGNQAGSDYYGFFGVGMDSFRQYLENGLPDDRFEPNNTPQSAAAIGIGTYLDLVLKADFDWYRVSIPPYARAKVTTTPSAGAFGISAAWFAVQGDGAVPLANGSPFGYPEAETDQQAFLKIYMNDGTRQPYTLTISAEYPTQVSQFTQFLASSLRYASVNFTLEVQTMGFANWCWVEYSRNPDLAGEIAVTPTVRIQTGNGFVNATNLDPSTTYYARGACRNYVGVSRSNIVQFQTSPFSVPGNLIPFPNSLEAEVQPTFQWGAADGEPIDSFDFYFGMTAEPQYVTSGMGNTYTPGYTLIRGATYYWQVRMYYKNQTVLSPVYSFVVRSNDTILPFFQTITSVFFPSQLAGSVTSRFVQLRHDIRSGPGFNRPITLAAEASGDYFVVKQCPALQSFGDTCTLEVSFKPTTTGSRNGVLTIFEDAGAAPRAITLVGSAFDISLRTTRASRPMRGGSSAIASGQNVAYEMQLDTGGANVGAVELSCAAQGVACSVSTPTLNASGVPLTFTASVSVPPTPNRSRRLRNLRTENVNIQVSAVAQGITRTLSIPVAIQR